MKGCYKKGLLHIGIHSHNSMEETVADVIGAFGYEQRILIWSANFRHGASFCGIILNEKSFFSRTKLVRK